MTGFLGIGKSIKGLEHPLTKEELIRAVRLNIASEHEAVFQYEQLKDSIDDECICAILDNIISDELTHAGQWMDILTKMSEADFNGLKSGCDENKEIFEEEQRDK